MNNSELSILRNIDLDSIITGFGYEKDKKQSDSRRNVYETSVGKISIQGPKFFNFSTNKGGGGAIDLTMHLKNCSFKDACNFLGGTTRKERTTTTRKNYYSEKEKIKETNIPERDGSKINVAIDYLVNTRKIPSDFVNLMVKHNAIYANSYGSVVFKHCSFLPDDSGKFRTTGATVRGTKNKFKQTLGNKDEGLFWFGKPVKEAEEVILAESPIDIISYFSLKSGSPDNCFISLSGLSISFPSSLKKILSFKKIILALDNPAFEKNPTANEANLRLEEEIKLISPNVFREIPNFKDFNEDLIHAK